MYAHSAGHIQLNLINAIALTHSRATTCSQPTSQNSTILWEFRIVPPAFGLLAAFHTLLLRMLFRTLSGLEIFTSFCVLRYGDPFATVTLSQQNLFRSRTSFAPEPLSHWIQLVYQREASRFLKWTFAVMQLVFCTLWQ